MNKLGKNKFLLAMGVLFGIAVVAWAVLVLPAGSTASGHNARIKKSVDSINRELIELPGEPNVKTWSEQAEALKTRYSVSLRKQLEKDQNLGQWFEGLDDNSTFATFFVPYDDMRIKLEDELIEKGVELGSPVEKDGKPTETRQPGFNWITRTDVQRADTHDKEMQAKEILQKRFNISRAIVNAVTADYEKNSPRKRRLLDVTFLEKFPYLPVSGGVPGGDAKLYSIPIDHRRYVGYAGPGLGTYSEHMLPSNGVEPAPAAEGEPTSSSQTPKTKTYLGKTLTFGFAVVMEYHQVPNLLRHLIEPATEPSLNLSIVGVNVFVQEPNLHEKVEVVVLKPGEEKEAVEKKFAEMTANGLPPQVHVYVTCQVFDLDPAAVPAFLKP